MIIPIQTTQKLNLSRITAIRNRLERNNYTVDIQQLTSKLIDLEIALSASSNRAA